MGVLCSPFRKFRFNRNCLFFFCVQMISINVKCCTVLCCVVLVESGCFSLSLNSIPVTMKTARTHTLATIHCSNKQMATLNYRWLLPVIACLVSVHCFLFRRALSFVFIHWIFALLLNPIASNYNARLMFCKIYNKQCLCNASLNPVCKSTK